MDSPPLFSEPEYSPATGRAVPYRNSNAACFSQPARAGREPDWSPPPAEVKGHPSRELHPGERNVERPGIQQLDEFKVIIIHEPGGDLGCAGRGRVIHQLGDAEVVPLWKIRDRGGDGDRGPGPPARRDNRRPGVGWRWRRSQAEITVCQRWSSAGHRQCAGQSGTTDFTDIDPTPALQEHGRRADGEVAPALGSDLERDLRRELAADRCVARSRVAG